MTKKAVYRTDLVADRGAISPSVANTDEHGFSTVNLANAAGFDQLDTDIFTQFKINNLKVEFLPLRPDPTTSPYHKGLLLLQQCSMADAAWANANEAFETASGRKHELIVRPSWSKAVLQLKLREDDKGWKDIEEQDKDLASFRESLIAHDFPTTANVYRVLVRYDISFR